MIRADRLDTLRSDAGGLRILMVASEAPPTRSGIARTIEYMRDGLTRRGHHVDVVAHPEISRLVVREIRLYSLPLRLHRLLPSLDDYDVVHLHGAVPTFSDSFLLASRLRRPTPSQPVLVYTHHCDINIGWARPVTGLYNRVHRRLSKVADQQVSTTLGYAAQIGLPDDVAVIPLGIDLSRFASDTPKDSVFTVLFAGQFRPYKGVRRLIQAMSQVHGARLLLAGRGPEERIYRDMARQLGVDVEFHVEADDDDLRRLYQRAHVIVLPSVTEAEAFGLVLLEGMAAGCVPLASDLPGVRDVLGRIGFTFPRNGVRGLVETLRRLRDDRRLVQEVGARARDRAAAFSWDRTIDEYERLFQSTVLARDLRTQLRWPAVEDSQVSELVAAHIQQHWSATHAEVYLPDGDIRSPGASTSSSLLQAVGRYVSSTGESVLLEPDSGPRPLLMQLSHGPRHALGVPLTDGSRPFGALVATRAEAFEERDRQALALLARHVAPVFVSLSSMSRMIPFPDNAGRGVQAARRLSRG